MFNNDIHYLCGCLKIVFMDTVNVKIDVTTAQGYKLVRELYGKKGVEIESIKQDVSGTTYSVKEVFDELKASLKKHYGEEK